MRALRVTVERTGGLAGMRRVATVDTAGLGGEGIEVERWVEEAGFFTRPPREPAPSAPDRFKFRITVEDGPRRHVVEVGEAALEGPLRALVDRVLAHR